MPSTSTRAALTTKSLLVLENQRTMAARCWWGYVHHHV
jgi:hypothetical protein